MPTYDNLSCITEKIGVNNPCIVDQSAIEYFIDEEGISLSDASKIADERYVTGQALVNAKINKALDDVYHHLTRNVNASCDLDKADGILCDNDSKIARAVFYRTIALLLKELTIDTSRYNDYVHYSGGEALASLVYYDSTFKVFTTLDDAPSGLYQRELDKLESIRTLIEQTCCGSCQGGTGYSITIP